MIPKEKDLQLIENILNTKPNGKIKQEYVDLLNNFSFEVNKALYHSGMFEHAVHAKICDIVNDVKSKFINQ